MKKKLNFFLLRGKTFLRFLSSLAWKLGVATMVFSSYFFVFGDKEKSDYFSAFFLSGAIVFIVGLVSWLSLRRDR